MFGLWDGCEKKDILDRDSVRLVDSRPAHVESENSDEIELRLHRASNEILDRLRADEASRSELVSDTGDAISRKFVFSVKRRDDFRDYLAAIVEDYSKSLQLNKSALGAKIADAAKVYEIPAGATQKVTLRVPLDINAPIVYESVSVFKGREGEGSSLGSSSAGRVMAVDNRWRYGLLIDLAPPE